MLNIIYDATQLVDGENNNSVRRGIYFVSLNILKEMLKRTDVSVCLWTRPCKSFLLDEIRNKYFRNAISFYGNGSFACFLSKIITIIRLVARKNEKHRILRKILWGMVYLGEFCIDSFFSSGSCCSHQTKKIFFSPQDAIPKQFQRKKDLKRFVVLYDTIPYKIVNLGSKSENGWFWRLAKNMNSSDYYFAISEATKKDFCTFKPQLKKEHIWVTPLAASDTFRPISDRRLLNEIKRKYNIPVDKKYVFSLCTLEPRKNLVRAVRCFLEFISKHDISDFVWVMGGGQYKDFSEQIKRESSNLDLYDRCVQYAGYIEDVDLPALYSDAEWFVFTSQYEGFGLPPLEAMQCGCPVITSNNSSLPEVVGNAGIMIDWDSDEQHIDAYEKYYFNEALRKENSREGLERVKLFSWEKTVEKMICVMNEG